MANKRGGNRENSGKGGGRPAANDRGQKVGKMVHRGTTRKGAWGMAADRGGTRLRESAPRSGACYGPHMTIVGRAASMEV